MIDADIQSRINKKYNKIVYKKIYSNVDAYLPIIKKHILDGSSPFLVFPREGMILQEMYVCAALRLGLTELINKLNNV